LRRALQIRFRQDGWSNADRARMGGRAEHG
jgi:hypothetical protein